MTEQEQVASASTPAAVPSPADVTLAPKERASLSNGSTTGRATGAPGAGKDLLHLGFQLDDMYRLAYRFYKGECLL